MNNANNELVQKNIEYTQEIMRLQKELSEKEEQLVATNNELKDAKELIHYYRRMNNERYKRTIDRRNKSIAKFRKFKDIVICIVLPVVLVVFAVCIILSLYM